MHHKRCIVWLSKKAKLDRQCSVIHVKLSMHDTAVFCDLHEAVHLQLIAETGQWAGCGCARGVSRGHATRTAGQQCH